MIRPGLALVRPDGRGGEEISDVSVWASDAVMRERAVAFFASMTPPPDWRELSRRGYRIARVRVEVME